MIALCLCKLIKFNGWPLDAVYFCFCSGFFFLNLTHPLSFESQEMYVEFIFLAQFNFLLKNMINNLDGIGRRVGKRKKVSARGK